VNFAGSLRDEHTGHIGGCCAIVVVVEGKASIYEAEADNLYSYAVLQSDAAALEARKR
jgi:hypothetical protein